MAVHILDSVRSIRCGTCQDLTVSALHSRRPRRVRHLQITFNLPLDSFFLHTFADVGAGDRNQGLLCTGLLLPVKPLAPPKMASISKLQAALTAVTNEVTLTAANLNFDFALIKCEAPKEFQRLGSVLSKRRKDDAECI